METALYEQLLAAHPDKARIYVICDNARYYKNQELRQWLADKPLYQVFLPLYSPNLNLMERFWKYLLQKIINATFYRTKGQFRAAILDFFTRLPEFGTDLAPLMTRKFHITRRVTHFVTGISPDEVMAVALIVELQNA